MLHRIFPTVWLVGVITVCGSAHGAATVAAPQSSTTESSTSLIPDDVLPDPTGVGAFAPWDGIPLTPLPRAAEEVQRADDLYFGRGVAKDDAAAFDAYSDAADDGSLYAMNRIGTFYALGIGGDPDPVNALAWYTFAATRGYVPALVNLATAMEEGEGIKADTVEAFKLSRRINTQTFEPHVIYKLGHAYAIGLGTKADIAAAVNLLQRAADQHVALAAWDLGTLYLNGNGIARDTKRAAQLVFEGLVHGVPNSLPGLVNQHPDALPADFVAALQGLLKDAGFYVGDTTSLLDDVTKASIRKAFNSQNEFGSEFEVEIATMPGFPLERAAQKAATGVPGDPGDVGVATTGPTNVSPPGDAITLLGQAMDFYNGAHGQPQDYAKAAELFQSAAKLGDGSSMLFLGLMAENGYGRAKNADDAIAWYQQAGDAGNSVGYSYLADVYAAGAIVPRDDVAAVQWYRKAAEQGNAGAMFALGIQYFNGDGVAEDHEEAVAWWKKAVAAGNLESNWRLALCYLYGDGVDKDTYQAAELTYYVVTHGLDHALDQLNNIARSSTTSNYRRHLQELLAADGYYSGAIDGSFGPQTQSALGRAFGSKLK